MPKWYFISVYVTVYILQPKLDFGWLVASRYFWRLNTAYAGDKEQERDVSLLHYLPWTDSIN
jgi:hypothetical protein